MITRTINAAVGSVTEVLPRIVGDQLWRHGTETDVSQTALQTVRILQARHRLEERQVLRHTHKTMTSLVMMNCGRSRNTHEHKQITIYHEQTLIGLKTWLYWLRKWQTGLPELHIKVSRLREKNCIILYWSIIAPSALTQSISQRIYVISGCFLTIVQSHQYIDVDCVCYMNICFLVSAT